MLLKQLLELLIDGVAFFVAGVFQRLLEQIVVFGRLQVREAGRRTGGKLRGHLVRLDGAGRTEQRQIHFPFEAG